MKTLLKKLLINYLSLYILTLTVAGFRISNGITGYTKAAIVLALIIPVVRPVLKTLLFPINILTLGLFNFLINFILIYLFTIIIKEIEITPYLLGNINILGIAIDNIYLSKFAVILIIGIILSLLQKLFTWILE